MATRPWLPPPRTSDCGPPTAHVKGLPPEVDHEGTLGRTNRFFRWAALAKAGASRRHAVHQHGYALRSIIDDLYGGQCPAGGGLFSRLGMGVERIPLGDRPTPCKTLPAGP